MGVLEEICAERKLDAARAAREKPPASLEREAAPPRRAFGPGTGSLLIAECKKASPSRGLIARDYDPASLARAYERGGAGMISVLTEPRRFLGADEHLRAVREVVALPLLRKDFIVEPYQVVEAWAIGADVILLIAAALETRQLEDLAACAHELGLQVLLEIHGPGELEAAAAASPDAIGVNSRDLRSLAVDPSLPARLLSLLPPSCFPVAESGIATPQAAAALRRAGFRGFLVGEAFSGSPDPEGAVASFAAALRDAAAERREGPAQRCEGPAPRREGSAPRRNDSAPRRNDSAPRREGSAPLRNDSAPQRNDSAPRRNDSAPRRNESAPRREGPAQDCIGPAPRCEGSASRCEGPAPRGACSETGGGQ